MRALLLLLPLALLACTEEPDSGCEANTQLEIDTNDLISDYREDIGLQPLLLDACASEVARVHSEDMAAGRVPFSHDGFDARAEEIGLILSGVTAVGENVAWLSAGFPDPANAAYEGWLGSPGHLANIETDVFNTSGMAVATDADGGTYFTHLLIAAD